MDGMAPQPWDIVQFIGDYPASCVGLAGSYSVISLTSGDTGTVTLSGSTHATEFSMGSGAVVVQGSLSGDIATVQGGTLTVASGASLLGIDVSGGATVTIQGMATLGSLNVGPSSGSLTLASGGRSGTPRCRPER
jgi:hypothetical protein